MTHPYSGDGPSSASSRDSPNPGAGAYRRLSYASVAAGLNLSSPQQAGNSNEGPPARARHNLPTHEASIYSSRSMDIDSSNYGSANARRPGTSGATGASWASDSMRYAAGANDTTTATNTTTTASDEPPRLPTFFTPSYLRRSRYVQKLRKVYDDHQAAMQERAQRKPHTSAVSLSASSSSVNLTKLPSSHVHRGVVQDVIERIPPASVSATGLPSSAGAAASSSSMADEDEGRPHPLPSRWNEEDKMSGLELMADGAEVRFNGVTKNSDEAAAVRSDYPMPKECGLFYFEITILSRGKDGLVGIGFSSRKANLNRLPGWESESWAYHGDDGCVFRCTSVGTTYGPRFASQDVVGCGVNFRTGNAFFTKNGNYLGTAFNGIKGDGWYPSVGMKKPGEHLRVNFGRTPFVFDIDRMMEQERVSILAEIGKTDVSGLHPPDNEQQLIHNLVSQYLAHEGYVETAKAFARDVHDGKQSFAEHPQPFEPSSDEDDIHAINRQKIRKSILEGDIDRALKYTTTYYPHVLEEERNRDTYFRLRCRKFIEMMRRYTELCVADTPDPAPLGKSVESFSSNGHAIEGNDTQMELDDQLHRETSRGSFLSSSTQESNNDDVDMDASQELVPKFWFLKANELLTAAVKYGQELREEFGADPRPAISKQLTEIFAIMAYTNLSGSPISHLFDPQGRAQIAEEVNGAILVALGKPSSAALEKLCAQTAALLDELGSKTGHAAAFINVQKDFLQE